MAESYPTEIEDLAKAIAIAEHGKDKVNSGEIPNNNPGNIKGFKTGKFVNYPTLEKGWDALKNQASKFFSGSQYYNPEMTIKEMQQSAILQRMTQMNALAQQQMGGQNNGSGTPGNNQNANKSAIENRTPNPTNEIQQQLFRQV